MAVLVVSKFNILSTFGAAYTMSNLSQERWLNLLYLNVCIKVTNRKMKRDQMIAKNNMEVFGSQ